MDNSHRASKAHYTKLLYIHLNEVIALAAKLAELEQFFGDRDKADAINEGPLKDLSELRDDTRADLEEMGELRTPVVARAASHSMFPRDTYDS